MYVMHTSINNNFDAQLVQHQRNLSQNKDRGTQRGYSSKPLKHSIVKRILVFKGPFIFYGVVGAGGIW